MPTNTPSSLEIRPLLAQVFNYYFCLCRGVAVTTGLAFAHVFVEAAVVEILITYFTGFYSVGVRDAVGMINLLEGSSSFLVPVMTYISNNHASPLKVILCSTAAYITGMVMLCISYFYLIPDDKIRLYFVAAVLFISVGKSGGVLILGDFVFGQLTAHEPRLVKDEGRKKARINVLWTTALLLSRFLTIKFFNCASWSVTFICLTSVMGIGYLLFLCCIPLYHRSANEATTTEISHAIPEENISVDEGTTTEISSANFEENIPVDEANTMEISRGSPEENISVDEDTTIDISYASPEENINNGLVFFAISLVKQWKPLSVMIPMWTTFLVFGLVLSAGDTFFTEQGDNMDPTVSLYTLLLIKKIISLASVSFSTLLSNKYIPKQLKTQSIGIRIWIAMVLSVCCCGVAWRVEVRRLQAIADNELCFNQDADVVIPMSIMWLAPQFCLLALMEGIGTQGLDRFFEVQVSDVPMEKYGRLLNEAIIGFGKFLNGLLVFLLRCWFGNTLNCSRLDKYFQMLTVVSFVNMCCYWRVSTFYSNKKETTDDVKEEEVEVPPYTVVLFVVLLFAVAP